MLSSTFSSCGDATFESLEASPMVSFFFGPVDGARLKTSRSGNKWSFANEGDGPDGTEGGALA